MDDMIRQRHLRDGVLKAQGPSTFAIVNPECLIRRDKVTNRLHVRWIQYRTTSDSWRFLPDVISRLRRYAANDKIFKLFFLHPFLASTIYNNTSKNKFDIG